MALYEWHKTQKGQGHLIIAKSMRQPDGTIPADRTFVLESRDRTVSLQAHGVPQADVTTFETYVDAAGTPISILTADGATVIGYPININVTQIRGTTLFDVTLEIKVIWPGG